MFLLFCTVSGIKLTEREQKMVNFQIFMCRSILYVDVGVLVRTNMNGCVRKYRLDYLPFIK